MGVGRGHAERDLGSRVIKYDTLLGIAWLCPVRGEERKRELVSKRQRVLLLESEAVWPLIFPVHSIYDNTSFQKIKLIISIF
jgi:hypothetical protein